MDSLNLNALEFTKGINFALKELSSSEDTIKTSRAASSLAIAYEAARNAVEFRSEHLIRQAAIVRILRRRLFLGQSTERVAPLLIRELIWARYLKEDSVPITKIDVIENIINKYRISFTLAEDKDLSEWLLELAGCEIEENLVFNPYPQLLINFVTATLQPRITISGVEDEDTKDIQIYIAVERAFAKNSEIFIAFHLLKAIFPEWFKDNDSETNKIFPLLISAKNEIDKSLSNPFRIEIKKAVSRAVAPFNVIREMVVRNPEQFLENISDKKEFEEKSRELLKNLYAENRGKSIRASTRSIVYIFLTKMVFAIALELPFDLFIGHTNFVALGINLIFPPGLMFLLNAKITSPDEENTKRILEKMEEYLYSDKVQRTIEVGKRKAGASVFEQIFLFIYSSLFVGIFAFILWGLNKLHFNAVSQGIFLFFLCVVSFFAYRVRSISRDYIYQESREGLASSFVDFIFLPVVRVGQWLSGEIAKLNVLGFVFDFIIEAPLKAFLEVIEEWVHFVRAKKEEIFTEG